MHYIFTRVISQYNIVKDRVKVSYPNRKTIVRRTAMANQSVLLNFSLLKVVLRGKILYGQMP